MPAQYDTIDMHINRPSSRRRTLRQRIKNAQNGTHAQGHRDHIKVTLSEPPWMGKDGRDEISGGETLPRRG